MDNTGNYISYEYLISELWLSESSVKQFISESDIALSNKVVDAAGDVYEYSGASPVIGDVLYQGGYTAQVVAILSGPNRIQINKTDTENNIAVGTAKLLHSDKLNPVRMDRQIEQAMAFIDRQTGQFFNKRQGEFYIEGNNSHVLFFNVPIIEIDEIDLNYDGLILEPGDKNDYIVFNGRQQPNDDRWNPRVELTRSRLSIFSGPYDRPFFWDERRTKITGSFGFLEPDGSTPSLIQKACLLVILDNLQTDISEQAKPTQGGLRRVKVDLHEKEFFEIRSMNRGFQPTKNEEVNKILAYYKSPIGIASSHKFVRFTNVRDADLRQL